MEKIWLSESNGKNFGYLKGFRKGNTLIGVEDPSMVESQISMTTGQSRQEEYHYIWEISMKICLH